MHFDLYGKLMSDTAFATRIESLSKELAIEEARLEAGSGNACKVRDLLLAIYRTCDYNTGLLVPYFFQRYPEDRPLSLLSRPFMFEMLKMQVGGSTTIRASRQIGKCVSGSTGIRAEIDGRAAYTTAAALFQACKD